MSIAVTFVAGLVSWTFLEYAIHYWLGHLPRGRILISREHLHHHADILYFTPFSRKVRGAAPVLLVVAATGTVVAGLPHALVFTAAIAIGWTAYEVVHQWIHVHGPKGRYGRWAARYHLHHHFVQPKHNHGVTTPIWDVILRTRTRPGVVRIPRKQLASVPWLEKALQSDEPPAFAGGYRVA